MRKLSAKFSFYKIICRQRLLFKITVMLPIDNRSLPFFSIPYAIYHHQEKKMLQSFKNQSFQFKHISMEQYLRKFQSAKKKKEKLNKY